MRAFKAERDGHSMVAWKAPKHDVTVEMARSARKTTEEMAAQYGARPEKKKGADAATDA
jgi:hypothetical protein